MEMNYKTWCRLCGSLETTNLAIDEDIGPTISTIFQLDPLSILICIDCTNELHQMTAFITKCQSVDKMFKGLDDEDPNELNIIRLNAYRNYFKLPTKIHKQPPENVRIIEVIEEIQEDHEMTADDGIIEEFIIETEDQIGDDSQEHYSVIQREEETEEDEPTEEILKMFNFQCHLCDHQPYENMKLLTQHCQVEHMAPPHVKCCSENCDKYLSTWRRLMIHKYQHFPKKNTWMCNVCSSIFINKANYEKHMKSHESGFICSFCAKSFNNKKILDFHESTHSAPLDQRRNIQCPTCERKFVTKQACDNHVKQAHERHITAACMMPKCGKSFFTRKAMLEHQRTHREKNFECDYCDHKTKTKSNLNAHMETHSKKEKKFECSQCGNKFGKERALKSHMLVHSNVSPYHCDKCNKKFKRHQELVNHLNVHFGIKPHSCSFCKKTFTNLSNLRKHKLRDHKEELVVKK